MMATVGNIGPKDLILAGVRVRPGEMIYLDLLPDGTVAVGKQVRVPYEAAPPELEADVPVVVAARAPA